MYITSKNILKINKPSVWSCSYNEGTNHKTKLEKLETPHGNLQNSSKTSTKLSWGTHKTTQKNIWYTLYTPLNFHETTLKMDTLLEILFKALLKHPCNFLKTSLKHSGNSRNTFLKTFMRPSWNCLKFMLKLLWNSHETTLKTYNILLSFSNLF